MDAPPAAAPAEAPAAQHAAAARVDSLLSHVAASVEGNAGAAGPKLKLRAGQRGGRMPHPDSLAPNKDIKRGSRIFDHLPPPLIRKGGDKDQALEARATRVAHRRSLADALTALRDRARRFACAPRYTRCAPSTS